METLHSTSGFTSEASASSNYPRTPPWTPHRAKRRLERSDSPASTRSVRSARSVQPAETTSPAKKAAKRYVSDEVKVEELTEGDAGYITDLDVVYPHELQEYESDSDGRRSSSEDDSDGSIAHHLLRLDCDDSPEAEFEKKRREKHLRKRMNARVFKRSHSQSVKSDTETTDPDAMADHDLSSSVRRLRRRVHGPVDTTIDSDDRPRTSGLQGLAPAAEIRERNHGEGGNEDSDTNQATTKHATEDAMDVDDEDS